MQLVSPPIKRTDGTSGELIKGITNNKNLGVTDQALLLFGNGDGGGGPTPKMLEKVRTHH